jgi:hypothetical protein
MVYLIIYLLIGVLTAINHIGRGRVGSKGLLSTFITVTLIWPIVLFV